MELYYRFTLANPTLGTQAISEPFGWDQIELNLDRHPDYHSLIETIGVPLEFYGSDGVNNGGYDFIKSCIALGADQEISIQIEIKEGEDGVYEDLYLGQLQTHLYKDFPYLKTIQVPIIRNNLWAKFISRLDFPIDLSSTTSIDGATVTARPEFTLPLPSQIIRQTYDGELSANVEYNLGPLDYGIIDMDVVALDEIKDKFNYPQIASDERPFELFAVKYGGEHQIDIIATVIDVDDVSQVSDVNLYVQINDDTPVAATVTQQGVNGVNGSTKYEYSDTHTLAVGDHIRIYFKEEVGTPVDFNLIPVIGGDITSIRVIADTIDTDTTTPAWLVHDAALAIVDRIVDENNAFSSSYFGGGATAIPYGEDGCGYPHAITKGVNVRGYSISSKPFHLSFKDWWEGVNPIFGLGLGYEALDTTPESEVIVVDKISDFYDASSNSIELEDVDGEKIEFSVDDDIVFKKIKAGYSKWDSESASGIDDHQTKHDYTAAMRVIGNEKDLLSGFYAASLGIEQTRRNRVDAARDWRLDEDVMIIHLDMTTTPEQPATYPSGELSNLNGAETRYNVRLDPYMSVKRWMDFLSVGLSITNLSAYNFAGGEGNTAMQFTNATSNDCESAFDSNDDVAVETPIHSGVLANFSHPLTYTEYKAIRAARKKSIGFAYIDRDGAEQTFQAHIKSLKYAISKGMANFTLWLV